MNHRKTEHFGNTFLILKTKYKMKHIPFYSIVRLVIFLALVAYLTSCTTPRECYTNGGKPINPDSKGSVKRWNSIKS